MTLITGEQPDARESDAADPDQLEIFIVGDSVKPAEVGLAEVPKLVQKGKRDGFVWLHLVDPAEDTVNAARETLNIHPTAAADVSRHVSSRRCRSSPSICSSCCGASCATRTPMSWCWDRRTSISATAGCSPFSAAGRQGDRPAGDC